MKEMIRINAYNTMFNQNMMKRWKIMMMDSYNISKVNKYLLIVIVVWWWWDNRIKYEESTLLNK